MKLIPNAVSSRAGMLALHASKHSPQILFGAGVVGVGVTAVMAARATLKLDETLSEIQENLAVVNTAHISDKYTEKDQKKHKTVLYLGGAAKVTKLYAPTVAVGLLTIGLLAGSHNILNKRNAGLTAAYAALDKGYKQYRARVVEDLGEEADKKYHLGIETHTETTTDETGKKHKTTTVTREVSEYGRLFTPDNRNYVEHNEYNLMFLRGIQTQLNDRLNSEGFLTLNDVYDELGFDRTQAGLVVGWVAEGKGNGQGDGYIDFGVFSDTDHLRVWEYAVGKENEIYLDFNVDGNIFDQI